MSESRDNMLRPQQGGRDLRTVLDLVAEHSAELRTLVADVLNEPKLNCESETAAFNAVMQLGLAADDPFLILWQENMTENMKEFLVAHPDCITHLHNAVRHDLLPGADIAGANMATAWQPDSSLSFVLWNCRGVRDKGTHVQDLLSKFKEAPPAVVVLTETKLRDVDLQKPRLRDMFQGYTLKASCHPDATAVRWNRRNPRTAKRSDTARACAGVLVAVHDDFAQPHLLRTIQPPASLRGYMCHVSISLPDSKPLHVLAVYQPNHPGWQAVRAGITAYIQRAKAAVLACGGELLLAGDWNSVQQPADRQPQPRMTPMDNSFVRDMALLDMQSAFAGMEGSLNPDGRRPSFQRQSKQGVESASRIDDFLCIRRCGLAAAAERLPQPELITDMFTECSDHRPVQLDFRYKDIFNSPPPVRVQRPPPRPAFKPLSQQQMGAWSAGMLSRSGTTAAAAAQRMQALAAAPAALSARDFDTCRC